MATATATATVATQKDTWQDRKYWAFGSIAIQAGPATYATGGLTVNLNIPLVKASRAPRIVEIWSQAGFSYKFVPGSNNSNGLIKIFVQDGVAGNPLAEMANATAIPAGVSGDTITFRAMYDGME